MKSVLIAVFLHILSTSLQEESLGHLHPARIYNAGVTKVNEGENVIFKCAADRIKENKTIINMFLFKNGERFKLQPIDATIDYIDTTFILTNITVEQSGLYTCLYSEEKLHVSKTNATGNNSVTLEVLGKILPAKIEITETLKLTCTFTKIPNCTQVYVYLSFNGIGNSKKQVHCSHTTISTTFQLIFSEENYGNYSCVYSVSNYSLSEVRNTGENTIFVEQHETNIIIHVSVAVSLVLLALLGFCCCRKILCSIIGHQGRIHPGRSANPSQEVWQNPTVRNTPNESFYHEIATDAFYTLANGELPLEDLVDGANAPYSLVQIHEDKQPEDKNVELNAEAAYYDSIKAPYAAIQKRKGKAEHSFLQTEQRTSRSCKASETNAIYSLQKY